MIVKQICINNANLRGRSTLEMVFFFNIKKMEIMTGKDAGGHEVSC